MPSAADGSYFITFNHFAGGGSGELFFSDTESEQFQTNVPVDLASVTGPGNYFLAFIDLSVRDGMVTASSTALGTLTYLYTPAATPEPSSVILAATGLLGMAWRMRKVSRRHGWRTLYRL